MSKNCIFHQESSQKSFSIDFMRNMCTYPTSSGINLLSWGSEKIPLLYTIINANLIETCVIPDCAGGPVQRLHQRPAPIGQGALRPADGPDCRQEG